MKVCPKCGATDKEKEFIGSFCVDCYPHGIRLRRNKITIVRCPHCGRVKVDDKWVKELDRAIKRLVKKITIGDYEEVDVNVDSGKITYTLDIGDRTIKITKQIKIEVKNQSCDVCSRRFSGYYEAIIQIRGEDKEIKLAKDRIITELEKQTFISKIEEVRGGVDIYIGKKSIVDKLLNRLGYKYKKTYKLYGRKEGREVYRTTYLIRV